MVFGANDNLGWDAGERRKQAMATREVTDQERSTHAAEPRPTADVCPCASVASELRVLTYHRVGTLDGSPNLHSSTLSATPEGFDSQMRMLAKRFRVLSLAELLDTLRAGRPLPARSVLITFDDACRCFAEQAWPILRRYQLPATLFVPTSFPSESLEFWWDTIHRLVQFAASGGGRIDSPWGGLAIHDEASRRLSFRQLADWYAQTPNEKAVAWLAEASEQLRLPASPSPVLTWDELRGLADHRLSLAAHSRGHQPLTALTAEQLTEEIEGSSEDLRREMGAAAPVFAYPGGYVDERVREQVRAAGIELAFGTRRGANKLHQCDPLLLRRINVGRRSTPARVWAQLMLPASLLNLIGDHE